MKRERYFRDELQRLFIGYAILPAALFTLVCGLVFLTALLYGRSSLSKQHNEDAAVRLEGILNGYEQGLKEMASVFASSGEEMDLDQRSRAFEAFYRISNKLGYEAGFYVLDQRRQLLFSNRQETPEYLKVPDMAKWGIFYCMDENPGQPVVRLLEGWKPQGGDIVLGMRDILFFPLIKAAFWKQYLRKIHRPWWQIPLAGYFWKVMAISLQKADSWHWILGSQTGFFIIKGICF